MRQTGGAMRQAKGSKQRQTEAAETYKDSHKRTETDKDQAGDRQRHTDGASQRQHR